MRRLGAVVLVGVSTAVIAAPGLGRAHHSIAAMYDRDKTISREWYDPVGWAGLDKVPTRTEELDIVLKRQANIEARCASLRLEILEKGSRLKALGIEAEATRDRSHLS